MGEMRPADRLVPVTVRGGMFHAQQNDILLVAPEPRDAYRKRAWRRGRETLRYCFRKFHKVPLFSTLGAMRSRRPSKSAFAGCGHRPGYGRRKVTAIFCLSRRGRSIWGKISVELRAVVQTLFWKASNGIFLEVLFQTLDDGYSAFYELRSRDLFVHPDITI
jgi:hypothetical protein